MDVQIILCDVKNVKYLKKTCLKRYFTHLNSPDKQVRKTVDVLRYSHDFYSNYSKLLASYVIKSSPF